jgi:hypothetical protein
MAKYHFCCGAQNGNDEFSLKQQIGLNEKRKGDPKEFKKYDVSKGRKTIEEVS